MGTEVPDAGDYIRGVDWIPWLGDATLDEIARIQTLSGEARSAAADAVAAHLTDDHILLPYTVDVYANFFGAGIGCGIVQPAIGAVDLLTLCRTGSASASPSASP